MTAYKLLRQRKNKTLGSLFINKRLVIPINTWLQAEEHKTKGYSFRPFWHCTEKPEAPHLSIKNRVWCKVEIADFEEMIRPNSQGGKWYLAKNIKILEIL